MSYWCSGDLFRFWNSTPNTVYVILGFDEHDDALVANLGDGTLKRVSIWIIGSAQVSRVRQEIEGEMT